MAVTKELYERYKQMKAEGKSISLSELKEQLEKEKEQNYPTQSTQSAQPTGFSALNKTVEKQEQQTWSTTYSTNQTIQQIKEPEHYSGNVKPIEQPGPNKIKKFALIGYPLGHSLSEYIHNAGFKSLGLDARYDILETRPEELVDRIKYLKNNGYTGFNVTIPLKLPISMFLDEIDSSVDTVSAINTVKIDESNVLKGYNTDIAGFVNSIPEDVIICGKTAGILGTGGAARAVITALAQSQIKSIKLYTRNVANSLELLDYLRKTFPNIEFNAYQIDRIRDLSDINILINATPIGMQGYAQDYTPIEEPELKTLPEDAFVYDVIYNPKKTRFIRLAQQNGYKAKNGLDMLVWQAYEAQKIWTGNVPDFKDMKIAALENL